MKKFSLFLLFSMLLSLGIDAKVKLPSYFGDGMVLQQKSTVPMHGTAAPGAKVTITASWSKKAVITKADADGAWCASLSTPAYGGPYSITVSDGTALSLSDILVGEVWVCAGQSNMEMPMKGFRGQPTHGTADMILSASPRLNIRLLRQTNDWATVEKSDIDPVKWTSANSADVAEFSAVGYVFGKTLLDALNVPVGLIQCDWSMSTIETWMPRSTFLSAFPEISLPATDGKDFGWIQGTPTLAWNAMVAPWKGFPVAGVIWFQGEANTPDAERYSRLFPAMVADWRAHFGNNSNMPFFFAQLAPWNDGDCRGTRWAEFRQMQNELLKSVPATGMVTIGDLGDSIFIHFPKKVEVGKRFAYLALDKAYGRNGIKSQAPIAKCCKPESPTSFIIEFEGGEDGLTPENVELPGFELVDAFGNVHPAKAKIINSDNKVRVWTDWLQYPVEVRYGYHNYYESSLFNNAGLPAAPFRMEIPKQKKTALMWFDAEANYRRFNNPDSIVFYVKKVADLGFTHAVVDVRPITGEVLYNSAIAPKVKDVTDQFDYLARFIEVGHKYGLKVLASMNVFCAGHNYHDA
ncbi:MAG: sialate O-acetylesterase, partial [Muribaculaceae bacterium]